VVPVTWRFDPDLFARVQTAARARGISVQAFAAQALAQADGGPASAQHTTEDRAWLDTDLSRLGEIEPYDWGPDGPPPGRPLRYVPGRGLVTDGDR